DCRCCRSFVLLGAILEVHAVSIAVELDAARIPRVLLIRIDRWIEHAARNGAQPYVVAVGAQGASRERIMSARVAANAVDGAAVAIVAVQGAADRPELNWIFRATAKYDN